MKQVTLHYKIPDMTCESCEMRIRSALKKQEGVLSLSLSVRKKKAEIKIDPSLIQPRTVENLLSDLGYPVKKGAISRWLERMAQSNEKNFGRGTMDCCSVNQKRK